MSSRARDVAANLDASRQVAESIVFRSSCVSGGYISASGVSSSGSRLFLSINAHPPPSLLPTCTSFLSSSFDHLFPLFRCLSVLLLLCIGHPKGWRRRQVHVRLCENDSVAQLTRMCTSPAHNEHTRASIIRLPHTSSSCVGRHHSDSSELLLSLHILKREERENALPDNRKLRQ